MARLNKHRREAHKRRVAWNLANPEAVIAPVAQVAEFRLYRPDVAAGDLSLVKRAHVLRGAGWGGNGYRR